MNINNIYDSHHHYYYKLLANPNKTNNTKIINKTKMPTFTNSIHHHTGSSKHEVRRGGIKTQRLQSKEQNCQYLQVFLCL